MSDENKREKMLERVRALLAKADGTNFPAEADAFRAKAEALMMQYTISEWEITKAKEERREVVVRDVEFAWYYGNSFSSDLYALFLGIARHCRCKVVYWSGVTGSSIKVLGLNADLDYMDLLFTTLMLEHAKGLEPKPKNDESMIDYLVRAKEAGMKWERIGNLMLQYGIADFPEYQRNVGVRFTKLYTDYCANHNRPRLRTSPAVYQRSFSQGFVFEIRERLSKMRRNARDTMDAAASGAMDLVLADITTLVEAEANKLFGAPPAYRGGGRALARERKIDMGAYRDGAQRASEVRIAADAQSGLRRQQELGR